MPLPRVSAESGHSDPSCQIPVSFTMLMRFMWNCCKPHDVCNETMSRLRLLQYMQQAVDAAGHGSVTCTRCVSESIQVSSLRSHSTTFYCFSVQSVENFDKIWTEQRPFDSPCSTPTDPSAALAFEGFTYIAPSFIHSSLANLQQAKEVAAVAAAQCADYVQRCSKSVDECSGCSIVH